MLGSAAARAGDIGDIPPSTALQVEAATPVGRFGLRGQAVISSDAGLFISNTQQTGRSGSTTTMELRPAVDYFPLESLSVGGFVGVDYTNVPSGHSTTVSIGPRLGWEVRISPHFSLWPRAGLSFASTTQRVDAVTRTEMVNGLPVSTTIAGTTTTTRNLAVDVFVPMLIHPVDHFFLGFGPALDADVTGKVKATTLAARLTIGGWL